jgi:hypothetical protein
MIKMLVNNLMVEALNPKNVIAQIHMGKYSEEYKTSIISHINFNTTYYKKIHVKVNTN